MCCSHLYGVFERSSQEEEGSGLFKALLSQQGESIFQSCLPPAVLSEVVLEELSHLLIMLRPERRKKKNTLLNIHIKVLSS